jgi:hypothetical protein
MRIYLTIAILFISVLSFAQNTIPKKANLIQISDTIPEEAMYKKFYSILLEKGYMVDNADKDMLTLSTSFKEIKYCKTQIMGYIKDKTLYLSGNINMPGLDLSKPSGVSDFTSKIDYRGSKGSAPYNAWNELNGIALSYGGKITYQIK